MRKLLLLAVVLMIGAVAPAFAYTINDPVGVAWPTPGYDRIGDVKYELFGMNISQGVDTITFDIFSNFNKTQPTGTNPSTWYTTPGDLFFDFDSDGQYDHGVAFTNNSGLVAGGFYSITSANKSDFYAKPNYVYHNNQFVTITGGSLLGMADMFYQDDIAGSSPDYMWHLVLDKDYFTHGDTVGLHYAVATCANDYMDGSFTVTPEPATMLLFGMGVAGLAARLRRKNRSI